MKKLVFNYLKNIITILLKYLKKFLMFLLKYKYIFISALLGIIIFIIIFGVDVLNPTFIDWILEQGEVPSQHYIGWEFYRNTPWTFPLGLHHRISYPYPVSIIFTNSIPWMAILFKLFSNVLPEHFQYLGMYALLCFILQGVTSSIILKKFIKDDIIVIISSIFFMIAPTFIYKLFFHTALVSHYLILFGLILVLYKDNLSLKKSRILWGLLAIMSASTHIYFLVFNGITFLGFTLYELLTTKNIKKIFHSLFSFVFFGLFTIFIFGGFSMPTSLFKNDWIGFLNFNLTNFINPANPFYSKILNVLPSYENSFQFEGFSYFGFGCIVLTFLAIITFLFKFIHCLYKKEKIQINKKLLIVLLFMGIISLIIATATKVYFSDVLIFEYELPEFIGKIASVFISNGRFIWLLVYIIMILSIIVIYEFCSKKVCLIIMLLLLCFQIYDIQYLLFERKVNKNNYEEIVINDKWKMLVDDYEHVIYTSDYYHHDKIIAKLNLLVAKSNKTINYFYLAQDVLKPMTNMYLETLLNDTCLDCIYIMDKNNYFKYNHLNLHYYELDGLFIGSYNELYYLEKMSNKNLLHAEISRGIMLNLESDKKYKITILSPTTISKDNLKISEEYEIVDNSIELLIENKEEFQLYILNDDILRITIEEINKEV